MSELSDSYERCEAITRAEAANFYYGIRLLPRERRRALCAAYAFARRIDDIGDGDLPSEEKLVRLARAEQQLRELGDRGPGGDPVMVALEDAGARFRIPVSALQELIEGVRMDVLETRYETFEELVGYCRRVAGAIGRVCLSIFDSRAPARDGAAAAALADDLGVALQLTNILRDVREDAENGRVYLPGEDLRRFGLSDGTPLAQLPERLVGIAPAPAAGPGGGDPAQLEELCALVRFEADRAQRWFERGMQLVPLLDRRSGACVRAMAGIYHRVLERIERDPERVLRERVSLSGREKAWVAARALAGASS
ncbi:MAG TPA: squalene/phytoene synthase family protein [Solirubrobacteraceae bacterium]|nr:squalene/phytoene synthase family protein [Solirubrobacteraceae bacterium]